MRLWKFALLAVFAACGDNHPGDKLPADAAPDAALAAPTTIASPSGGTVRALPTVTLTADRAATIYYTVDGSEPTTASASGASPVSVTTLTAGGTLKFFAAPASGPNESVKTETYVIDRLGPIAIDAFTATTATADIQLAWTNPTATDFTDVVIARTTDVATTAPTDGASLAVGDTVGAGKVIYVGSATSFTDVAPGTGGFAYVAWARYKNLGYAEGRTAAAYVEPAAAQVGQIKIDTTGAGSATVTTQPANWTLAIANFAIDAVDATKISFDVTATSTAHGVTFVPKLVSTNLSATAGATATLTADGVIGTSNVVLLGPAVAMGGSLTKKVAMTISAPSVTTFDFTVRHDRAHYWANWAKATDALAGGVIGDLVSTATAVALPVPDRFTMGHRTSATANGAYRDLVVSSDGRWIYAGQRAWAHVVKIDTTTGLVVAGLDLGVATTRSSIQIALDPSGRRLYAVLNDGMHIGADHGDITNYAAPAPVANTAYLLEIDTATMTEQHRLPLTVSSDPQHVAKMPILSRDGRLATFPIGGPYTTANTSEIAVVDLSKLALRDADPATAGQQNVGTGADRPVRCWFTWTADHVVCVTSTFNNVPGGVRNGDRILIVDAATSALTVADLDGVISSATVNFKSIVPTADGKAWVLGEKIGLAQLDPAAATVTAISTVAPAETSLVAEASPDGTSLLAIGYRGAHRYTTVDGVGTLLAPTPNNKSMYGHTMALSPF